MSISLLKLEFLRDLTSLGTSRDKPEENVQLSLCPGTKFSLSRCPFVPGQNKFCLSRRPFVPREGQVEKSPDKLLCLGMFWDKKREDQLWYIPEVEEKDQISNHKLCTYIANPLTFKYKKKIDWTVYGHHIFSSSLLIVGIVQGAKSLYKSPVLSYIYQVNLHPLFHFWKKGLICDPKKYGQLC